MQISPAFQAMCGPATLRTHNPQPLNDGVLNAFETLATSYMSDPQVKAPIPISPMMLLRLVATVRYERQQRKQLLMSNQPKAEPLPES